MNSSQWQRIIQEMGVQIGNLSVQLAIANAKIQELQEERVSEDGSISNAEEHPTE